MIQIRKSDGTVIPVPADGHFVELINDLDGTLQMVLFQQQPGCILQFGPGSKEAARYQEMFSRFGVTFTPRMLLRQ